MDTSRGERKSLIQEMDPSGSPGVLQSMGLQRVGHSWAPEQQQQHSSSFQMSTMYSLKNMASLSFKTQLKHTQEDSHVNTISTYVCLSYPLLYAKLTGNWCHCLYWKKQRNYMDEWVSRWMRWGQLASQHLRKQKPATLSDPASLSHLSPCSQETQLINPPPISHLKINWL